MQRRVEKIISRWERRRAERQLARDLGAVSPAVREDYLAALHRAA